MFWLVTGSAKGKHKSGAASVNQISVTLIRRQIIFHTPKYWSTHMLQKNPSLPLKNGASLISFLPWKKDMAMGIAQALPRLMTETPKKALNAAVDPK